MMKSTLSAICLSLHNDAVIPILLKLFVGRGKIMQVIDLLDLNKGVQDEHDSGHEGD